MEQNALYYNPADELDEELTIDLKKIFFALWTRKWLIAKVFVGVLAFFISLTFILPKKYTVDADLYINKANSTNIMDINPYAIEELGAGGGGMAAMIAGGAGALTDELELMQSPLVMDKVIKENDIKYQKLFGIFPTVKTGQPLPTEKFLKRVNIENKKGTKVVKISYKSKDKDLAYNVVTSIINNYVILHKQLHSEKAKADKAILEKEYKQLKEALDAKVNAVSGIPETALNSSGGISVMSAFSNSAQSAMSTLKGQIIAGQKSKIEVTEEASKVAHISSKLEWAKMVEEMSDSSKVLVLKEPRLLKDYEQTSPKLFTNILLGIVFGVIASLFAVIFAETMDKKVAYSTLGENIIYGVENDFSDLQYYLLANQDKKILFAMFDNLSQSAYTKLQEFKNISLVKGELSNEFVNSVKSADEVMIVAKVGATDSKLYKQIKAMLKEMNKNISKEILV